MRTNRRYLAIVRDRGVPTILPVMILRERAEGIYTVHVTSTGKTAVVKRQELLAEISEPMNTHICDTLAIWGHQRAMFDALPLVSTPR